MDLKHIHHNFQLKMATLFAAVGVVGAVPFMIYRALQGGWLISAVTMLLIVGIVGICVHGWRGGNIERPIQVIVVLCTAVAALTSSLLPGTSVLWMYPVLLANFLLVRPAVATMVALGGIVAVLASPGVFPDAHAYLTFMVTVTVSCLFALIFALRTNAQRVQLEDLATHDALTGIHNRRMMEREIAIAIEAFTRHHQPYGLALADLDHFKRINDAYGHEAGDRVLVDFAALVGRITRRGDRFFRLGGEEFVLLLPGADAGALEVFCEHLRQSTATQLRCADAAVTVSIGAATLRAGDDGLAWLARADTAAYEAKRRGRDCVVVDADAGVLDAFVEPCTSTTFDAWPAAGPGEGLPRRSHAGDAAT